MTSSSGFLRRRWRLLVPRVVLVVGLGLAGWYWSASLVPSTYSVMDMGHAEHGGGPAHAHEAGSGVTDLTGPQDGAPDVAVELAARHGSFALAGGERVDGYTLNGTSPGPAIEARQGDLVQVTLTNVDVPMFHVSEGDVVRMTITNDSGDVHPMHLHGHHAVVLSRDGTPSSGSPWWVDSLNVEDGESCEIAFVADNPGIWMDHCHNLDHARDDLVAHLAYAGVTGTFEVGGDAHNEPE